MLERYSRQTLFEKIGKEGQKKLLDSHALIIGVGALGSVIANNLARGGVGKITIIDRDIVELSNLQRQILFTEEDAENGVAKAEAAVRHLKEVNSDIEYESIIDEINAENIEGVIDGVDVIVDGTDNFSTRLLINDAAIKHDIPWVYGGAVSDTGMLMTIVPGETPCFRCMVGEEPESGSTWTCDTVGVLNSASGVIGNLESLEAMKLLMGSDENMGKLLTIDFWSNEFEKLDLPINEECPSCQKRDFEYLRKESNGTKTLCGRESVQISPAENKEIDLNLLADKLRGVGEVNNKGSMIKFNVDEYNFTIFSNGRAIIKGTNNPKRAKSLYSQYIGD